MKTVALIVGHKPSSPGAINDKHMVSEFEFNQKLVPLVAAELIDMGINPVIIYRDTYAGLPAKVNKTEADIAVSFHCNACDDNPHGSECLYYYKSSDGMRLARLIQEANIRALGLRDRGAKPIRADHQGKKGDKGGYLVQNTIMPCVINEPFFIDSDFSYELANNKIAKLSLEIAKGIKHFFEV